MAERKIVTYNGKVLAGAGGSISIPEDGFFEKVCSDTFSPTDQPDCSKIEALRTHAFYLCSSLENFPVFKKLKTIGTYAFYNCKNLKNVDFPTTVETIGDYAFYGCSSLPVIDIPTSIKTIGNYAFYGVA